MATASTRLTNHHKGVRRPAPPPAPARVATDGEKIARGVGAAGIFGVGLLVAGDLPTAARLAGDSGALGAQDDLLDFALSPEYLDARDAIGVSVAV